MITALLAAAAVAATGCDLERPSGEPGCLRAAVDALPMTALQVVGTHNSYKEPIAPAEMKLLRAASPRTADSLDYSHPTLTAQLDAGARQLELDLVRDPEGGRWTRPLGLRMAGGGDYDAGPMASPGLKVMHVPDIDYRSVCPTFRACLEEVRAWSDRNPDHLPLLIMMNLKDEQIAVPGATPLLPFDAAGMDEVDAEIRAVFGASRLITPDQVRASQATLAEAVRRGGWPSIGSARGKVFFAVDEGPKKVALYARDRPSLEGRAAFVNTDRLDAPYAAYVTLNEPARDALRIVEALGRGMVVRTRADADTVEARTGNRGRPAAAFASGAQYISTDYMTPDLRLSDFVVTLPGGGTARRAPLPGPAQPVP
jgi:hypothetical protein